MGSDTRPHQASLTRLTAEAKRRSAQTAIRFGRFETAGPQLMGGTDFVVDRSAILVGMFRGSLRDPRTAERSTTISSRRLLGGWNQLVDGCDWLGRPFWWVAPIGGRDHLVGGTYWRAGPFGGWHLFARGQGRGSHRDPRTAERSTTICSRRLLGRWHLLVDGCDWLRRPVWWAARLVGGTYWWGRGLDEVSADRQTLAHRWLAGRPIDRKLWEALNMRAFSSVG